MPIKAIKCTKTCRFSLIYKDSPVLSIYWIFTHPPFCTPHSLYVPLCLKIWSGYVHSILELYCLTYFFLIVQSFLKLLSFILDIIFYILYNLSQLPVLLPCFLLCTMYTSRDKWVPVTMARRVLRLRMEEWPPIWKVAANIMNMQPRTSDKGWSSSLGVGRGVDNSSPKYLVLLWNLNTCIRSALIPWYDLSWLRIGADGGHLWVW